MRLPTLRPIALLTFALAACGQGQQHDVPVQLDAPPMMIARGLAQAVTSGAHLTYRGGRLLAQPQYSAIYWGSYWTTAKGKDDASFYDAFLNTMSGSARFMSVTREYSQPAHPIGPGSYRGGVTVSIDPGAAIQDSAIRELIKAQIDSGRVARPDTSQVYVVMLPPGTSVQAGADKSCDKFCGYHWDFSRAAQPDLAIPYIVMPHPDCWGCRFAVLHDLSIDELNRDSTTVILSHEMIETATDPVAGSGWYDDANGEISDICGGSSGWFDQGKLLGFRVQKHWSNEQKACVIERDIPVTAGGCPAETHPVGSICAPNVPASCSSAGTSPAWALLAACAVFVLRRRRDSRH